MPTQKPPLVCTGLLADGRVGFALRKPSSYLIMTRKQTKRLAAELLTALLEYEPKPLPRKRTR